MNNIFPQVKVIPYQDPVRIFKKFSHNGALFLDSACQSTPQGKYTFIAVDPFLILTCKNKKVTLNKKTFDADPFEILNESLRKYPLDLLNDLPPFQGGIAGMLGYELGTYLEKIPKSKHDDLQFPDLILGFYDLVIAFDHQRKRGYLFSSGYPEFEPNKRSTRAKKRLGWLQQMVSRQCILENNDIAIEPLEMTSTFNQETYQSAVTRVIDYILAGDIFEANISQRFTALRPKIAPFKLYQLLRQKNPAPFAAYMQFEDWIVASSSPERFLKLSKGSVQARPIKGTRSRDKNLFQDTLNAKELQESEKDRAENTMIVDLMRNDLSRVCLPSSVTVSQLCGLESFAHVHHLVSVIEGKLTPDKNAIDLLKATFPGGSITGAPKIRAMEIIAEIEPTVRGPYCGSMGYLAFNGEMDLSITIRSILMNKTLLTFQTGGAITAGSYPLAEYEETITKAKALHQTINGNLD